MSMTAASSRPGTAILTLDGPHATMTARDVVDRLRDPKEAVQRLAVFKLQDLIGDPSFADHFAADGGLPELQRMVLDARGNALAYTLASFSNLLALDQGWEVVSKKVHTRIIDLISHPSVNVQRAAMTVLVHIVSRPAEHVYDDVDHASIMEGHLSENRPEFYESLVSNLDSSDHNLCAIDLALVNAFIRKAFRSDDDLYWTSFMRHLFETGLNDRVYLLMQGSGLDTLAEPLAEYQALIKVLIRRWNDLPFRLDRREHRQLLKNIDSAGLQRISSLGASDDGDGDDEDDAAGRARAHADDHDDDDSYSDPGYEPSSEPSKWRRLGFGDSTPADAFDETGYLGAQDLVDFAERDEDSFQHLLLEQSKKPLARRCPIARASLAVTSILFAHYEISDARDETAGVPEGDRLGHDAVFKPHLLHWDRLHAAGVLAFLRLWASTGAETRDFYRIQELTRVLVEQVLSLAPRTKPIEKIEDDMAKYSVEQLRKLQMSLLEMTHDEVLGPHIRQVREDLRGEAFQFVKEQRIRCLLQGAWFPTLSADNSYSIPSSWRFAKLSHNRRWLHYDDFPDKRDPAQPDPPLDSLDLKLDLSLVTSVVCHRQPETSTGGDVTPTTSAPNPLRSNPPGPTFTDQIHEITLHGHLPEPAGPSLARPLRRGPHSRSPSTGTTGTTGTRSARVGTAGKEVPLLTLCAISDVQMAEWFDGLLMLLDQPTATSETEAMTAFIADYGLKIRLLNVRFEEALGGIGSASSKAYGKEVVVPSREGVDDHFFYDMGAVEA